MPVYSPGNARLNWLRSVRKVRSVWYLYEYAPLRLRPTFPTVELSWRSFTREPLRIAATFQDIQWADDHILVVKCKNEKREWDKFRRGLMRISEARAIREIHMAHC